LLTALGTAILIAACSSSPQRAGSDTAQTGAAAGDAAVGTPVAPTAGNQVRLGFVATAADSSALVGVQDNLFLADLGSGVALEPIPFSSSSAEESALVAGRLDAAYLDPVSAVRAWQSTRGGVRVVSGAASAGGKSAAELVVTSKFLAAEPGRVQGLLKGQVQAAQLLLTNPISARQLAVTKLASLGVHQTVQGFAALSAGLRFGCDPLESSVRAQAQQAASTGALKPVSSLSGLYDLVPVNKLLRAAGFARLS
jgi:ABC-type nitrate/sulfonate/bicarbonate transport system substrate-binding protein